MSFSDLRRGRAWVLILGLSLLVAAALPASAQNDKKQKEKLGKEQKDEIQALVKVVSSAMAGQAVPNDFMLGWHNDFMKAQQGKIFVPFTISIDPASLTTRSVSLYVRAVAKAAAPPAGDAAAEAKDKEKAQAQPQPQVYAFEDLHLFDLKEPAKGQPYKVSRAIMVPGGDYDVYVAMRERKSGRGVTPKVTVLKQSLTVPDYWNGELTTSSVLLADSIEALQSPLSADEQLEKPYTIGVTQITPAADNKFTKTEELSVMLFIYNPALKDKRPDVAVEWKFHQKTADGEKYFNRTPATALNASTLPPQFDLELGHQLVAGQSVPLTSFPEGDYRLEIEVTDNLAQKKLTREVFFTVVGS